MGVVSDYLNWRRLQPDVGCMFARVIAARPEHYKQAVEAVTSKSSVARVAAAAERRVKKYIDDKNIAALALVFPEIVAIENLIETFCALGSLPEWKLQCVNIACPEPKKFVGVCLSRQIPFGEGACPSEALVLGPFDVFPRTRRSPVTAMELFVGEPRPFDPKEGKAPTTKANLAHMEMFYPTHAAFQRAWNQSMEGRTKSLNEVLPDVDGRAKAKIAFAIPSDLAASFGLKP